MFHHPCSISLFNVTVTLLDSTHYLYLTKAKQYFLMIPKYSYYVGSYYFDFYLEVSVQNRS